MSIRAAIKTASLSDYVARQNLKRKYKAYSRPSIVSSPCFRQFYEVIGDPQDLDDDTGGSTTYLALEWLDNTLASVPLKLDIRGHLLVKTIVETVMSRCVSLSKENLVNIGTAPTLKAGLH